MELEGSCCRLGCCWLTGCCKGGCSTLGILKLARLVELPGPAMMLLLLSEPLTVASLDTSDRFLLAEGSEEVPAEGPAASSGCFFGGRPGFFDLLPLADLPENYQV